MLHIDQLGSLQMSAQTLIGESVAVLGIKGSGKTNTAAVIIEELLPLLPMTIVDIEGEYWGLRERFDVLVVGKSPNVQVSVGVEQAAALARFSVEKSLSLILDVSEFDEDERTDFLLTYFESLWAAAFTARRPYQIVLEEAHEFIPQLQRTPLKKILTRFALRGRKRGVGLIIVSQRSAKIDKDVLTQAGVMFLHKVMHPTDIKVYQDMIPQKAADVEQMISRLTIGEAIVHYGSQVTTAQMRLRHTYHAGATPELGSQRAPRLRSTDVRLLEELKRLSPASTTTTNDLGVLRAENQRLATKVRELEAALKQANEKPAALKPVAGTPAALAPMSKPSQGNPLSSNHFAASKQQSRLNRFVDSLLALPSLDRQVIVFLSRLDQAMTVAQIARSLGWGFDSLYKNQPKKAISLGVLQRSGSGPETAYTSLLKAYLKREFPDLDARKTFDSVIARLEAKFQQSGGK